ncbi:MAG: thioredoxin domain-containing protein [Anaeromyxobacter sp.]
MHALALALLVTATPAPSPAAEPLPPGVVLAPDAPVMTVDGDPVLYRDLPADVRALTAAFPARRAAAREAASRRALADALLSLEAKRRGVTPRALWEEEVLKKVGPTTADELTSMAARTPRLAGKKLEDVRGPLEGLILAEKLEVREAELARSLEAAFPERPPAPPQALAQADRKALEELMVARWRAANAIVDERLVRGTAYRERVTVEVLRKDASAMARLQQGHAVKFLLPEPPAVGWTPELEGSPSRGPADAKVTFVEYADFQCPYCGRSWPMVHAALAPYRDRVRYVFRNVPLPFHERALLAAEAGLAADAQGKFFELADLLFANQAELGLEGILGHARQAGLDVDRLARELTQGRWRAEALWQRREAFLKGLPGTPMLLVNGRPVPLGDEGYTVDAIRKTVEAALAEK